jgi:hypothetical protein
MHHAITFICQSEDFFLWLPQFCGNLQYALTYWLL